MMLYSLSMSPVTGAIRVPNSFPFDLSDVVSVYSDSSMSVLHATATSISEYFEEYFRMCREDGYPSDPGIYYLVSPSGQTAEVIV